MIPREVFFGNPDKVAPDLSPDGSQVAFIAPRDGVLNVWLAPVDDMEAARPLTADKHRGVRSFFWAHTGQHILYSKYSGTEATVNGEEYLILREEDVLAIVG